MAEAGRDDGGPGVIRSAFGLLELLRVLGRARLADLTRESGLPRTTVHRLMGQLTAVGAVERIDAHYRLGPNLLTLGQHVTPLERLRAVAQRPLIELAAATPAHVGLLAMAATGPIYLDVFLGRGRLPFRREPGEPAPSGSAGARLLQSRGRALAIDDGCSIDGVSCAAHALPLPGGDVACVGVTVPLPRLPRALLAPLQATTSRIAALLAVHPAEPM
ncbi:helix-turn-helix domain-containing protein [Pseudonocardia sp. CA-142604]|uniref:helix-turn-helix domain-containing protein n=1 Tax=Pseudonocardia sp. CA-142604 TaxID=3240024 RepID=UPI003D91743E